MEKFKKYVCCKNKRRRLHKTEIKQGDAIKVKMRKEQKKAMTKMLVEFNREWTEEKRAKQPERMNNFWKGKKDIT